MPNILINPLDERKPPQGQPAPRLSSLEGTTVGLLDISKPGGSVFLDRLESLLKQNYGVREVVREAKPTFAKPAPPDVIDRLRRGQVQAVIEALAD
jgi:hypothetical protein